MRDNVIARLVVRFAVLFLIFVREFAQRIGVEFERTRRLQSDAFDGEPGAKITFFRERVDWVDRLWRFLRGSVLTLGFLCRARDEPQGRFKVDREIFSFDFIGA